jgi:twinkle protein
MAEFLRHEPCPGCGSKDNLARYADGSGYCFGCEHHEPPSSEGGSFSSTLRTKGGRRVSFLQGTARRLASRKITQDTCEKFGYIVARDSKGEPVQVAPYYNAEGQLVAQKVRTADKDFYVVGSLDDALPFGARAWPKTGKKIVVTEGEIDAMAMSQVQGNAFPVVSIASGAGPQTKKYMARHRDYFRAFDEVILMFDMDEPGRKAVADAAAVIGFDKARIATLPLKDAGDMLAAGRQKELVDAMWRAEPYRPEGIVDLAELKAEIKQRPREGLSWCFPALTRLTFGKRRGELVAIGAGTGIGKTDFLTQDMRHMVEVHGEKIGVFALEQNPKETGLRLVGKFAERPLHIPDSWDEGLFDTTWERWIKSGQIFLYNSFGVNTWEAVRDRIKFLSHAHDVHYFYLDHLTAIAASVDTDERKALDNIMGELGSLVKELDCHVTFVSHLATPDGKPHEEGGRVAIRHFRGSRAIGFWAHYMIGLERDQQAEDPATRQTTTVRVLKDRYTGRATGETFFLGYDHERGMLFETTEPSTAAEHGFKRQAPDPLEEDNTGTADF